MSTFKDYRPFLGQDPHVVPYNGTNLLVQSAYGNRRIVIKEVSDLKSFHNNVSTTVWIEPKHQELWAPELHQIDSKWFIYYAASEDGNNGNHRMYVLEATDPLGPYRSLGRLISPDDQWAIDMTIFEHEGQRYAAWSGWDEKSPGFPQHLYGAALISPNRIGSRSCIASPSFSWEKSIAPVLEGPQILTNETGKLFLSYSANASWTQEYCVGLLEHNGGPILDPESWQKHQTPILTGGGHGCFVGTFYVYHRKLSHAPGWADREIVLKPITWTNGLPELHT